MSVYLISPHNDTVTGIVATAVPVPPASVHIATEGKEKNQNSSPVWKVKGTN